VRVLTIAILIGTFAAGWSPLGAGQTSATRRPDPAVTVASYCAGCHNGTTRAPSGAALDRLILSQTGGADADLWARAYRQLQAGTMPPVGAPRPNRAESDQLLEAIESRLVGAIPASRRATETAIADRVAGLIWNSPPDPPLADAARRGELAEGPSLERQVRRMLGDERAVAFVVRFFFPWLELDQLASADPDLRHFPGFDRSLRDAMARETQLFILARLREDSDPIVLWTANETYLNERLARHYGIDGVAGNRFRRVVLGAPERAGLLGQGSVLMITSRHEHGPDAGYTSPAKRAVWVQRHFLGASPPQSFRGAQPVRAELPITPQTRALPVDPCRNCHRNFFPLDYALEQFDPIGRLRTHDQAGPVDASGSLVDGTAFDGVAELRTALLQRPDAFRTLITERLLAYASGSRVDAVTQAPASSLARARRILRGIETPRWSSIIAAVARTSASESEGR